MSGDRRVAVTGLGVVAPAGIGVEAFWSGLLGPGISDGRQSVEIEDWDPTPYFESPKLARRADRVEQFALAAAGEAFDRAGGFDAIGVDRGRFGTIFASGIGGLHTLEEQVSVRFEKGERRVSPFLVPMMMVNASGAAISMRYGLQGPERDDLHGVRGGQPRDRLRRPPDQVGRHRRRSHRWLRVGRHGHGTWRASGT